MNMVKRQNKRIKKSQSASYGSLTFWKNKDFWESMALYFAIFALLFVCGKAASLL